MRSERITNPEVVLDNAYLMEIEANCRMFLVAWNGLQWRSAKVPRSGPDREAQAMTRLWAYELWGDAYAMVEAARRLARVLWEVEGCEAFRLRRKLPLNAVLRPSNLTPVRDALEHIETRIPGFVKDHTDGDLSGWGVTNDPGDPPPAPGMLHFRYLNVSTGRCVVEDGLGVHHVNLRDLAEAVRGLCMALPDDTGGTWTFLKLPPETPSIDSEKDGR